ncbi:MAG: OsmC family peroxiredoxin [Gemmatimonadetes bacterium]|uniref:OsmC family peroxiredoxin n=1 Tax=Candidatus Kutchimonas denitrificans TaxID=3056748 RepID=A0AAE5CC35_9BACT|nr:OsmC family peroxiredoxin [Gemmatimonadota bacterium]NIR76622.1 OsmC family peroxiredoxin [Candidatus Kutchimonas denitrificans]NIS03391.1 OsmC family peroxiredoxin [Gemmatimonadota bacterium]NIT69252.1 OsmC family peroxiredoxin [Gemmatimonadota bacterium]NIU54724.1 OsmC family peroxiredoxin [Gemmatimonadota bacterium]
MPTSKATATWKGGLEGGTGEYGAGSGSFEGGYTAATRFEGKSGSNPEELLAAAHASCFSMALAANLEKAGNPPESITTAAHCTLEMQEDGPKITTMKLVVQGKVPGVDPAAFAGAAQEAKNNCPVSKALMKNLEVELEAKLA